MKGYLVDTNIPSELVELNSESPREGGASCTTTSSPFLTRDIPRASNPLFQHVLDTYASEADKVISVWRCFRAGRPEFSAPSQVINRRRDPEAPTPVGTPVLRRIRGHTEPPAAEVLPTTQELNAYIRRMEQLARPRLAFFATQTADWWLQDVPFFGLTRQRIWVFWRRVLHTCHHRTQLTVYLRLLNKPVPSVYGPTTDQTWEGAGVQLRRWRRQAGSRRSVKYREAVSSFKRQFPSFKFRVFRFHALGTEAPTQRSPSGFR